MSLFGVGLGGADLLFLSGDLVTLDIITVDGDRIGCAEVFSFSFLFDEFTVFRYIKCFKVLIYWQFFDKSNKIRMKNFVRHKKIWTGGEFVSVHS